jgi:large subunit ribosomal protein L4
MIKAPLYTHQGESKGSVTLPDHIFAAPSREQLTAQYIKVFLGNQRSARAKSQTRGEVNKNAAKVWRQKGTGRARHGSRKAPIFVGGGIAHGPRGTQNYHGTIPKRQNQQVTAAALSQKAAAKQVVVLEAVNAFEAKTKAAAGLFGKILHDTQKTLVLLDKPHAAFIQAVKNLPQITAAQAHNVSAYVILNHTHLVITQPALTALTKRFTQLKKTPVKKTGDKTAA